MIPITCREIAEAVSGKVLSGNPETLISGISIDTRSIKKGDLFVPLPGDNVDGHAFVADSFEKGAVVSLYSSSPPEKILQKGVIISVADTLIALQKAATYYRSRFNIPIVAVTGSSGKTTTKDLLATVLRARFSVLKTEGNYNNHIGLPLTLFKMDSGHDVAVVEMAMRGPGEIALLTKIASPGWAVITNIGEAHIERLGSVENIASAKGELLDEMKEGGKAILNGDDPYLLAMGKKFNGEVYYYGWGDIAHFRADSYRLDERGVSFKATFPDGSSHHYNLPLPGRHNVSNALAALAVGFLMGMAIDKMDFAAWENDASIGRMGMVRSGEGALIVDDTYNANPLSMKASLEILREMVVKGKKIAVLGDMLELGEYSGEKHESVGEIAASVGFKIIITVGKEAYNIARGAERSGVNTVSFPDNGEAWGYLREIPLSENDVVFLKGSRGMRLEELVAKLKGKNE